MIPVVGKWYTCVCNNNLVYSLKCQWIDKDNDRAIFNASGNGIYAINTMWKIIVSFNDILYETNCVRDDIKKCDLKLQKIMDRVVNYKNNPTIAAYDSLLADVHVLANAFIDEHYQKEMTVDKEPRTVTPITEGKISKGGLNPEIIGGDPPPAPQGSGSKMNF